ncbi:hypothetical protein Agub_g1867 [Astrephomene gubernaculifera]|uniref:Uncharacterized protein n=1 Tax=Astrephomene gubernaculifera TaxID=47775 RepID=A0AAD3HHN2_9CHLO|nr:hypothetical protein Agub_g1867 [Astrephomene gubernaculifera]
MNYSGDRVARDRFKTAEGRFHLHTERVTAPEPFSNQRSTRLTLASLQGGAEEGSWILFNVRDCVHISRYNMTHKEPYKSLVFNNSPVRTGYPTCHAFLSARDGVDLLVGLGDGTVYLMSLRAQLQNSGFQTKPVVLGTLQPEGVSESTRCTAVAWVPRSESGLFVASYNTGNIYMYKKAQVTGEGSGKFSLSLGSSSKSQSPSIIPLGGGGVNDVAPSPDGRHLAAACRDGSLRVVELGSGAVVAGFCSYYGALLCCCFSPDGKYVAAGGEDDLVAVYGLQERYPVVHGQGHRSWVSRVAWDPWAGSEPGDRSRTALSEQLAPSLHIYRLGSAGQDCQLCLWDVQAPGEGDINSGAALLAQMTGMMGSGAKRNGSIGGRAPGAAGGGSEGGPGLPPAASLHDRKASLGKSTNICPSLPRMDMYIVQPVMEHKLHLEPMCDLLFASDSIFTVDHTGNIRRWLRPSADGVGE